MGSSVVTIKAQEPAKPAETAKAEAPAAAAPAAPAAPAPAAPDPTVAPKDADSTGANYTGASTTAALTKDGDKVTQETLAKDVKLLKIGDQHLLDADRPASSSCSCRPASPWSRPG